MSKIIFDKDKNTYYFNCPHCDLLCQVPQNEIRCTIFRHGNFKKDFSFVPPHSSKEECDRWIKEDLIWGCGKPFRFTGATLEICDYI